MVILNDWIDTASANGIDTAAAVSLIDKMHDMFQHPTRYSTNDEYYLWLIDSIAGTIDNFIAPSPPQVQIDSITLEGDTVSVTVQAQSGIKYDLLKSMDISSPGSWNIVDTIVAANSGSIVLTDQVQPEDTKAFYMVEASFP